MSKYGFDLDGTLEVPFIAQLARDLYEAGHEVHVVTGANSDTGPWTLEARQEQLAYLKVPYTELHRCFGTTLKDIAAEKVRVLRENKIKLMIDDMPEYCKAMAQAEVGQILFVVRPSLL